MTRYGTDPLSGSTWPLREILTSAQMNNAIVWWRGLDAAAQLMAIANWPYVHELTSQQVYGAAWNDTLKEWVLVGDASGASKKWTMRHPGMTASASTPTDIGVLSCVACSTAGVVVSGSASTASTAQKILSGSTAHNLSGATTEAVTCAFYDTINSQFLVGLTGDKIEYSADGSTWSAATTGGGGFDIRDFATDGTTLVACCSSSATNFHSSTDGQTWTARTVPSGEYFSVEYHDTWSKFFAATNTTVIESSDGLTWAAGSATIPRTACYAYLKQFGDYMVALSLEAGGEVYVYASDDQCVTWTLLSDYLFAPAAYEPFIESSGDQLCIGQYQAFLMSLKSLTSV